MIGRDIVVIGGSAGGMDALRRICANLPERFPAAIFVVLHVHRSRPSALADILDRAGPLPARSAVDGDPIQRGTITVAPPDRHLLLRPGHVVLRRGPYENRSRPAINPLFRSAAVAFRSRVVAVVLSGVLDDGSDGLVAVKACGGICMVQHPEDAVWPEMPRNALRQDHVDHSLPAREIPAQLSRLVAEPPGPMPMIPRNIIMENRIAAQEAPPPREQTSIGTPSRLTCPHCGGVLNEIHAAGSTRFRCQIGHAFTPEDLAAAQHDELERALESALRMHHDRATLFRRMRTSAEADARAHATAHWKARATESERAADAIRHALAVLRGTMETEDAAC